MELGERRYLFHVLRNGVSLCKKRKSRTMGGHGERPQKGAWRHRVGHPANCWTRLRLSQAIQAPSSRPLK